MKKNNFYFTLVFVLIAVFFWQGIYLPKDSNSKEEKVFLIKKGEGTKDIALNLEKEGLIKSVSLFRFYALTIGVSGKLQAGNYLLSPLMNTHEITKKLVFGKVIKEKITIIEGWNLRDIGWYLENKGLFQAEELFEATGFPTINYSKTTDLPIPKDFSEEFDFLKDKPDNIGLEGFLFPDTYEITSEENVEEIIKMMLVNFGKKLTPEIKEKIKSQNKTVFEVIIMASLIEKEVRTTKDREIVSGVLWKRLKNGVPLQVDATISYITGEKTVKISKEETKIDSFYNTYKYRGLPLGPISNPGIESILAVLNPKESDFWYYLSTPEGETIFSETLEKHNIAKVKYLK
ncbi:MAG TPA: endolytic transglycosylase MltG [Candidatus Parcubacteria bacterium]|jgi:UPF0755 protein|nr:ABC transporter substrate-binding protein [Parcubacteria group bacterium]HJN62436.1 endolytic transglycosylase MltG [Candidatus Parcubacteria bacterium]|tara:strand:- start:157 stop:1194 length:1038 start_codon:yes stop_codon:yes gene_type:complete